MLPSGAMAMVIAPSSPLAGPLYAVSGATSDVHPAGDV
jgi:hypothetical protein